MKCKQIWKTVASCLLAALLFPGCSDEEGGGTAVEENRYRTLTITINSRDAAEPATKAEEVYPNVGDSEYERHIEQYWLVILKQSETGTGEFLVDRVITDGDDDYVAPTNSPDNSQTTLDVEVEIDKTYKFYALANLDGLENSTEIINTINGLEQGDSFSPETLNATMKDMSAYHSDEGGSYIPMTSYGYEQEITETTDKLEGDGIALIRLLGKVELSVLNETSKEVKVSDLTMRSFRTEGNIFLFPYDVTGQTEYLLDPEQSEILSPTFPEQGTTTGVLDFVTDEVTVPANTDYFFPSQFINETGEIGQDFEIVATVDGTERKPENITASFLRRNDWLKIPVLIAPVSGTIEIKQQHMPIGGLPTTIGFQANEPVIPITWVTQRHAGEIEVSYTLDIEPVDGEQLFTNPAIIYESLTGTPSGAVISSNGAINGHKLILNEEDGIDLISDGLLSGSFTVTTQELAGETSATIDLSLVIAEEGSTLTPDTRTLTIPYKIMITNGEE